MSKSKKELKKELRDLENEWSDLKEAYKKETDELKAEINSISEETTVTVYLHSSGETMWSEGKEAGLTEEQLKLFSYALYEVKFLLSVDKEGNAEIIEVDGKKLVD